MKYLFTFLLVIFFLPSFAQIENVLDEINEAYEYYELAFKKINSAKSYINECYSVSTLDDIQYYANEAESQLSDAKRYTSYAEDEASDAEDEADDINCSDAESDASNSEDYFYSAKRKISDAIDELSNAYYEDDVDYLKEYVYNAEDYIEQAKRNLNYAVDALNDAISELQECQETQIKEEKERIAQENSVPVTCNEFFEYIIDKGYQYGKVSGYSMDSEWLKTVTAYKFEGALYIVAEIKENEYSYSTKSYIFCGIPTYNWNKFKSGGYGDSNSYGERFHKYIFDYKCNCI